MRAIHCIECGTEFALDDALYSLRYSDQRDFTCPNGHRQHFTGKSEDRKQLERLERMNNRLLDRVGELTSLLEEWKQVGRHCPICHERVSQARSPEVAAHKLNLHLQQIHHARGAVLALMPGASA